jgi:nucleoside-diphosphate-sugar epimerase
MSKTILVTGAGGFIGSFVVKQNYQKYKIVACVSPFLKLNRLNDIKRNIVISEVNLTDRSAVDRLFKKYKPFAVVHLATHGVYTYQHEDTKRIVVDNYLMCANLLDLSLKYNVKKFINTGSVFEYGSQNKKVSETDVDLSDVLSNYAAAKMATTALTNSYSEHLNVLTLRPFTAYGPTEDSSRFVFTNVKRALVGEDLRIVRRNIDYVYVEDVASAYTFALESHYDSGEILNIGSGSKYTLKKIAQLIIKITKSKSKIVIDQTYARRKESKCWSNITKAKKIINWYPKNDIEEGLKDTIDWVRHN